MPIINCFAVFGNNLFVGGMPGPVPGYSSVDLSVDSGRYWISLANDLDHSAFSLAVCDTNILVGTENGVWRRPLSTTVAEVWPISGDKPTEIRLDQNYPDPVNSTTVMGFSIPHSGYVSLNVYDLNGREIARLVNENLSEGHYSVSWDAGGVPNGVYRYVLETEGIVRNRNLIVMK